MANHNIQRNFGLDFIRAFAIIIVLFGHGISHLEELIDGFFLGSIFRIDGVDIFFVLSGFLIGRIIVESFIDRESSLKSIFQFWSNRWFRTLPLYYFVLLLRLALAVNGLSGESLQDFSYKFFFFSQNFHWIFFGFFNESWSLAVEEWFYIFLPICVFGLGKIVSKHLSFWFALILFISISILYRHYLGQEVYSYFQWDFQLRKVVLCRLDSLMIGVGLAWFFKYHYLTIEKYKSLLLFIGTPILLSIVLFPVVPNHDYYKYFYFPIISIGIALCIPWFYFWKPAPSFFTKSITTISIISYSLYLFHSLVLMLFEKYLTFSIGYSALVFISYLIVSYIISRISYSLIELPMLRIRSIVYNRIFIMGKN